MLKKSVVIRAGKFRNPRYFKADYKTVIFYTLFICGIIIGIFISQKGSIEWNNFFKNYITNYVISKTNANLIVSFSATFLGFILIMLYCFVSGLCAIGAPFIAFAPILLGGFCGIWASQFLIIYGLTGFFYYALISIPTYAIFSGTIIRCCSESSTLSKELFYFLIDGKSDSKEELLKNYTYKYLIYLIPTAVSALVNSISFKLFSKLFSFN